MPHLETLSSIVGKFTLILSEQHKVCPAEHKFTTSSMDEKTKKFADIARVEHYILIQIQDFTDSIDFGKQSQKLFQNIKKFK